MQAITSLNSKVVSNTSDLLAPLAVDAVLKIIDVKTATSVHARSLPSPLCVGALIAGLGCVQVDLNDIKVVKKLGGNVEDTETIDGLVFSQSASHAAGGPTRIEKAKIALIQYQLSAPKTNVLLRHAALSAPIPTRALTAPLLLVRAWLCTDGELDCGGGPSADRPYSA